MSLSLQAVLDESSAQIPVILNKHGQKTPRGSKEQVTTGTKLEA